HAQAQVGLLACNERGIEPPRLEKHRRAPEGVAAAGLDLSRRLVPLEIAETVVDGGIPEPLADPPADGRRPGSSEESGDAPLDPARVLLAAAVDELHQLDVRVALEQAPEAFVPAAAGTERARRIERERIDARRARDRQAAIGRSGVHIHDRQTGAGG